MSESDAQADEFVLFRAGAEILGVFSTAQGTFISRRLMRLWSISFFLLCRQKKEE
ncbi:hypothetical protein JNM05_10385 [bacterium]|nr:hypothetical protein [bacterium]